jgi:hypothetical protein
MTLIFGFAYPYFNGIRNDKYTIHYLLTLSPPKAVPTSFIPKFQSKQLLK